MADKVRISKIEISGDGAQCRVFLSDGQELDGLSRVAPRAVVPDDIISVQIDAYLSPFDEVEKADKFTVDREIQEIRRRVRGTG